MNERRDLMGLLREYPDMADNGRFIFEAVQDGTWPFKSRSVTIELVQDMDFLTMKLRVEALGLPWPPFIFEFERAEYYRLFNPETILTRDAAEAAFNYYRHIPRVEPEDNIQLGEN
jgi:hypothetical protein